MAACQATLETSELLENIIVCLPPADIHKVKRVSSTWRRLIENSRSLRLAGCIGRARVPLEVLRAWQQNPRDLAGPIYEYGSNLRVHPSIVLVPGYRHKDHIRYLWKLPHHDDEPLPESASAFVTMPPCQAVAMMVPFERVRCFRTQCSLYVKEGIRIRDLIDIATIIRQQSLSRSKMSEIPVWVQFTEILDTTYWDRHVPTYDSDTESDSEEEQ